MLEEHNDKYLKRKDCSLDCYYNVHKDFDRALCTCLDLSDMDSDSSPEDNPGSNPRQIR